MTRHEFNKVLAAGFTATAFGYPANETVNIGVIGTGGRAQVLMRNIEPIKGARITGVCDVWDVNLAKGAQIAQPGAFQTKDFRELLDRKDIDAVIIGTPDHQHVPITVAACQAGKDVYVEKPVTHDISEGPRVIAAQNDNKRVVQVGMQQRSMPQMQKAFDIIRAGQIGKVHKVHLTWNRNHNRWEKPPSTVDPKSVQWKKWLGPSHDQAFDEYKFRQWRWFWEFGGGMFTDLMVHQVDIAHWILDLDHPSEAVSIGDNFATKGLWETPDTAQTLLRYPEKEVQVYFEGTFVNARNAAMIEIMGRDGTIYLDRGRYELYPEAKRATYGAAPEPQKLQYSEMILGDGPRGADFYANPPGEVLHLSNWIECIRSRKKPIAPVEAGVSSAAAAHLANRALRSGQVAHWG